MNFCKAKNIILKNPSIENLFIKDFSGCKNKRFENVTLYLQCNLHGWKYSEDKEIENSSRTARINAAEDSVQLCSKEAADRSS